MNTLTNHAYLWDGSQPDWVLLRINRQVVSIMITFGVDGPTLKEVAAIRAAIPSFAAMRPVETLSALKGKSRLPLGDFEAREGRHIEMACRRRGLTVESKPLDATRYLPFNEKSQQALLIEDHELATAVCSAALEHGIRVRQIET